jgi:hypothetical protein
MEDALAAELALEDWQPVYSIGAPIAEHAGPVLDLGEEPVRGTVSAGTPPPSVTASFLPC